MKGLKYLCPRSYFIETGFDIKIIPDTMFRHPTHLIGLIQGCVIENPTLYNNVYTRFN